MELAIAPADIKDNAIQDFRLQSPQQSQGFLGITATAKPFDNGRLSIRHHTNNAPRSVAAIGLNHGVGFLICCEETQKQRTPIVLRQEPFQG